jgi:rsbT co-antagonist protein RsbR
MPSRLPEILHQHESDILAAWIRQQLSSPGAARLRESDLRDQSREFLEGFRQAAQNGDLADISQPEWTSVREVLESISRTRATQGFTPTETATFVFTLKLPLFEQMRRAYAADAAGLADDIGTTTLLLDRLGLLTAETYQKAREEVIARQQQEIMELSTPVVKLWEGVLALPLIGTLDSARTQVVMESLLQQIVATGSEIAIIDITGVPTVDTLVAQHLLKTVAAARLMGADCIISGIRPQIAQAIVHLGVELSDVVTKATLADAFRLALQKNGMLIVAAKSNS